MAFVNCHDATTFGRTVHMTAYEERLLRGLLGALRDAGIILRASFEPALPDYGFGDVIDHLRGSVGAHLVGTGLAGDDRAAPGPAPDDPTAGATTSPGGLPGRMPPPG